MRYYHMNSILMHCSWLYTLQGVKNVNKWIINPFPDTPL